MHEYYERRAPEVSVVLFRVYARQKDDCADLEKEKVNCCGFIIIIIIIYYTSREATINILKQHVSQKPRKLWLLSFLAALLTITCEETQ